MGIDASAAMYPSATLRLAGEFDWVPSIVVARVVHRAAVTVAVVTGTEPDEDAVYAEARERLVRATVALLDDCNVQTLRLRAMPVPTGV